MNGEANISLQKSNTYSASMTNEIFVNLIKEYETVLYKVAYLYVKNEHDALEMVSETVYKAYKSRKKLKQQEYFKTWVTKILINNCLTFLKRNKVMIYSDEALEQLAHSVENNPEHQMLIEEALTYLKPAQKTAVVLRYYQDLSVADAALVMGIPQNTVKTLTQRGLKALGTILKEDIFYE